MREEKTYTFNWTAWISWVLLTTVGWLVGWVFLGELWIGLALGVAQWILLRSRFDNRLWWVLASLVGWTVGHLAVLSWLPVDMREWAGLPIGLALGVAQWLVIRDLMPRSGWWIIISALGWLLAMTGVLGGSLVGAVAGAVTGVAAAFFLDISDETAGEELKQS